MDGFLKIVPVDVAVPAALVAAATVVLVFLLAGAPILRRAVSDVDPDETLR